MSIQHILVPVDFSESTHSTVRYAGELAKKFSARITLYHVLHMVMPQIHEFPSHLDGWFVDGKKAAESRLQEIAASLEGEVQVEVVVEDGVPWDGIVKRAAGHGIDLIVMTTHGRTGLKHVLLGSVAERVVRHAPCSVTIVRRHHVPES